MHASFPYDGGRSSGGGGGGGGGGAGGGGGGGRGVEYGAVRRPDALLPPPGLDQTDLVLHSSLVDDPQVSDDVRNRNIFSLLSSLDASLPTTTFSPAEDNTRDVSANGGATITGDPLRNSARCAGRFSTAAPRPRRLKRLVSFEDISNN